jgi:hypothetical protein
MDMNEPLLIETLKEMEAAIINKMLVEDKRIFDQNMLAQLGSSGG